MHPTPHRLTEQTLTFTEYTRILKSCFILGENQKIPGKVIPEFITNAEHFRTRLPQGMRIQTHYL